MCEHSGVSYSPINTHIIQYESIPHHKITRHSEMMDLVNLCDLCLEYSALVTALEPSLLGPTTLLYILISNCQMK